MTSIHGDPKMQFHLPSRRFRWGEHILAVLLGVVLAWFPNALSAADHATEAANGLPSVNENGAAADHARPGDLNADGELTLADARLLGEVVKNPNRFARSRGAQSSAANLGAADVNGDGGLSVLDLYALLRQLDEAGRLSEGLADRLPLAARATTPREEGAVAFEDPVFERIVVDFIIGWSASNPETRNIGQGLPNSGWRGFVQTRVHAVLATGVRRIILHNPFGTMAGEPMQFDQYLQARNADLPWLTQEFVESWKPVTDAGIEVIAYIGSPRLDNDLKRILESSGHEAAMDYARRCVGPFLAAGMNIGYDAAAMAERGSFTHTFGEWMEEQGARLYIEARPAKAATFWHDNPVICLNRFWKRSDPDRHDDSKWAASNDVLTGEIIRLIRHRPGQDEATTASWLPQAVSDVLAEGHTVAVFSGPWIRYHPAVLKLVSRQADKRQGELHRPD